MEAKRVDHEPIDEQTKNTPIPIHVETSELKGRVKVRLGYRGKGGWKTIDMKGGRRSTFDALIPCDVVKGAGEIQYYLEVLDSRGRVLKSLGSRDVPQIVLMVDKAKSPPHFPNQAPPTACGASSTSTTASGRFTAEGDSPNDWGEFDGNGEEEHEAGDDSMRKQRLWPSLSVMQDAQFAGGFDVCSQESQGAGKFSCYRQDGTPYNGVPATQFGGEGGGYRIATTRLLAGADYVLFRPLTVGLRLGAVLRGGGPPTDGGKSFFPLHAEARVAYWFSENAYAASGVAPFAFAAAGFAQVDSMSTSAVNEDPQAISPQVNPPRQELDIWKKSGQAFASLGLGVYFEVGKANGFLLDARGTLLFPANGVATSASLGYAMGFDIGL